MVHKLISFCQTMFLLAVLGRQGYKNEDYGYLCTFRGYPLLLLIVLQSISLAVFLRKKNKNPSSRGHLPIKQKVIYLTVIISVNNNLTVKTR